MRVTVDSQALDRLIREADGYRFMRDQEFVCSTAEQDRSDTEFDELVAALDRREVSANAAE